MPVVVTDGRPEAGAKLAEALGVQSFRVERPDDFVAAVTKAIAVTKTGAPALVECIVKEGYDFSRS